MSETSQLLGGIIVLLWSCAVTSTIIWSGHRCTRAHATREHPVDIQGLKRHFTSTLAAMSCPCPRNQLNTNDADMDKALLLLDITTKVLLKYDLDLLSSLSFGTIKKKHQNKPYLASLYNLHAWTVCLPLIFALKQDLKHTFSTHLTTPHSPIHTSVVSFISLSHIFFCCCLAFLKFTSTSQTRHILFYIKTKLKH